MLNWSQEQLAQEAGIGLSTVKRMEAGKGLVQGSGANIWRVQQVLEQGGVIFITDEMAGPGVRLKATPS